MAWTKPSLSLDLLADGNRVLLVGVKVYPDRLEAAIAFFEAKLSEGPIMVGDNGTDAYRLLLPPEAVNLRGRSRAYRVSFAYAPVPDPTT